MVRQLNYNHLRYFYTVAREGSIVKAASELNVSPQTISGQLTVFEEYLGVVLFDRVGKRLILNAAGKHVYSYAEDIFSLGAELQQTLHEENPGQSFVFTVGVVDVIPKILASRILQTAFGIEQSIKLICREGDFDSLLAALATNKMDLVLSDRPLSPGIPIKAYNHFLGESGLSFYAHRRVANKLSRQFPQSLDKQPFLTSGDKSAQKLTLQSWFATQHISPIIVAEFDDSALMKYFGQAGHGVFCTPTIIEKHVTELYGVSVIGRTTDIHERFYGISPERKVRHPAVKTLVAYAQSVFTG